MTKAYSQLTITDLTDKQTYIKYSASATTGAIYDSPASLSGIVYIGICTISAENAPTDRTKYTWSQLTGSKGDPGSPGVASTVSNSVTSYCRASNGTGSAPSGIDTSIGTGGWQSAVPETNVDYPYLWTRVVISYTNTTTTSTVYSVSSTMDSIEADNTNLIGNALETDFLSVVQNNSDNPKTIGENALTPIQLNEIRGWSEQVKLEGKNLLGNWKIGFINSTTGAITSQSTSTVYSDFVKIDPNAMYTLTVNVPARYNQWCVYDENKNYLRYAAQPATDTEGVKTRKASDIWGADVGYVRLCLENTDSTNFQNLLANQLNGVIQLELGSTATDYEPYCGGMPAPNPDYPQPVEFVEGRNLFSGLVNDGSINASGVVQSGSIFGHTDPIRVAPGKEYIISLHNGSSTQSTLRVHGYAGVEYDSWLRQIGTTGVSAGGDGAYTFTVPSDCKYLRISFYRGGNIQLERGTIATPYVPYGYIEATVQTDNLMNSIAPQTINGITISDAGNGKLLINGTTTAAVNVKAESTSNLIVGAEYTISNEMPLPSGAYVSPNNGQPMLGTSGVMQQRTAAATSIASNLLFYVNSGVTFNDFILAPMLVEGATAKSYEPYTKNVSLMNMKPKNLLDLSTTIEAYPNSTSNTINALSDGISYIVPCNPNTTYTLSRLTSGQTPRFAVASTTSIPTVGASCTVIMYYEATMKETFVTGSDAQYLIIFLDRYKTQPTGTNYSLVEGEQNTPYAIQSLPNDVHDEVSWKFNGKALTKRVGFVDLGTLTWQKDSSSMRFVAEIPSAKDVGSARNTVGYCSHYELSTEAGPSKNAAFLYQKSIFVYDSTKINSMSAADFKTAMAGVTFLYELAKPIEIELESSDLSGLLFENNRKTYFKDKFTTLSTSSILNPFSISYKIPTVITNVSDNSIKDFVSSEEKDIILYSTSEQETLLLHGKYKINNDNSHFSILLIEENKNETGEASYLNYILRSKDNEYNINEWYNINEVIKFLEDRQTTRDNTVVQINLVLRFFGSISLKELKLERSTSPTKWDSTLQEKIEALENQLKVTNAAVGLASVDLAEISAYEGRIKSGLEDKDGHKVVATRFLATEALQTDAIRSSNLSAYTDADGILRVQTNDGDPEEEFRGKFSREGSFFDLYDGQIYSKNFRVDSDGNVTLRGNVTAEGGSIGGFKVVNGKLETTFLDNISAGIKGFVDTEDKKILWAGTKSSPSFYVDVDGKVVATSGSLGGIIINNTGIHSNTVNINNDGSFNIGDKLIFKNNTLSLSGLSLSLSSFDNNAQNQILKTKYITVDNGDIVFANVDNNNIPIGSRLSLNNSGLRLSDSSNNDKVNITENKIVIGNKNSSYVNIANDGIGIWNSNALGIAIDSTSINFIKNAGRNLLLESGNFTSLSRWAKNGGTLCEVADKDGYSCLHATGSVAQTTSIYKLEFNTEYVYHAWAKFGTSASWSGTSPLHFWIYKGNSETSISESNSATASESVKCFTEDGTEVSSSSSMPSDTWVHIVKMFKTKTKEAAGTSYVLFRPFFYGGSASTGNEYWVRNVKLEKGNKATDWTPAPEDSNREEEPNTLSIKVDPDNYNLPTITLGDSNGSNGKSLEISDSGIVMKAGITEDIVENGETKKKITKNKQLFSIGEKGFIFGDTTAPSTNNTYFSIGKNFAYDEGIGLALSMNAPELIWNSSNLIENALWEGDSNTNGGAPVNILITEHGMGFFQDHQVSDPIAYFSNNKFYVKRTQVVERQEISGFQWFVRNGSEYVTKEDGTVLHNLGLKWVG